MAMEFTNNGQGQSQLTDFNIMGHLIALGTLGGWFINILPSVATVFAIVFYGLQMYWGFADRRQKQQNIEQARTNELLIKPISNPSPSVVVVPIKK